MRLAFGSFGSSLSRSEQLRGVNAHQAYQTENPDRGPFQAFRQKQERRRLGRQWLSQDSDRLYCLVASHLLFQKDFDKSTQLMIRSPQ
ncbi:hypothetical protein FGO68_gene9760 [Halteria grandinella]|uniref:Uncharacterized protein n=1 Tax=Halteria grandinella TaxID=5974 RepID=A0A8J8SWY3_HALGN|nr:hypothetical protein FGO68_gene9760 [Halteria grandinella]